jgi:hypothetical protein
MAPAILALAQLAPTILGFFSKNETATKAAETVSSVARAITGTDTDEGALEALKANPALLVDYQRAIDAHALGMYQEETKRLESVNQTMRAEYTSGDPYVRRARPTFIYSMALSWTAQMLAISVLVIWKPEQAGPVIGALVGLGTMWSVALTIIGVAVHSRTKDKQVAAGQAPAGILSGLFGKK